MDFVNSLIRGSADVVDTATDIASYAGIMLLLGTVVGAVILFIGSALQKRAAKSEDTE